VARCTGATKTWRVSGLWRFEVCHGSPSILLRMDFTPDGKLSFLEGGFLFDW